MVTEQIMASIEDAFFSFSFADVLQWLSYGLALAAYLILIFFFYRFISHRDIFKKKITFEHPGIVGLMEDLVLSILRLIHYGVLFPIISFLWFFGFAALLFLIVQNQTVHQITLIAIALVTGARLLAYYNEEASQELAKTVPVVILGVALIEPDFFQFELAYERFLALPALSITLLQFIVYLSALELGLRFLYHLKMAVFDDRLGTREKK